MLVTRAHDDVNDECRGSWARAFLSMHVCNVGTRIVCVTYDTIVDTLKEHKSLLCTFPGIIFIQLSFHGVIAFLLFTAFIRFCWALSNQLFKNISFRELHSIIVVHVPGISCERALTNYSYFMRHDLTTGVLSLVCARSVTSATQRRASWPAITKKRRNE